jgi:hypothetical protein
MKNLKLDVQLPKLQLLKQKKVTSIKQKKGTLH